MLRACAGLTVPGLLLPDLAGTGHARGAAVSGAAAGSALKRLVLGSFKKKDGSDGFR